jgi:hypothetical protein
VTQGAQNDNATRKTALGVSGEPFGTLVKAAPQINPRVAIKNGALAAKWTV